MPVPPHLEGLRGNANGRPLRVWSAETITMDCVLRQEPPDSSPAAAPDPVPWLGAGLATGNRIWEWAAAIPSWTPRSWLEKAGLETGVGWRNAFALEEGKEENTSAHLFFLSPLCECRHRQL